MTDPQQPDLTNANLPWAPASFWRAGDFDPAALVDALKAQTDLADYADDDSNRQSRVRLDPDATNEGFWITVPDTVAESVVDAGVAAYTPPAAPCASNADIDEASASIVDATLAALNLPPENVPAILDGLLSQAKSAIPYYEGYTLTPDVGTAWATFQTLDQATKDRILYNCCRSLAALMRYLSGDLPTS